MVEDKILEGPSFVAVNLANVSPRKQPTFGDAPTGFPPNDVWETSAEIPY